MEPELKQQADAILASLGINATTAITMLYTQIVRHRGMPFELKIPNDQLRAALTEARDPHFRETARRYSNADDLLAELEA